MPVKVFHVSEAEFDRLIGENPRAFAAKMRAEEVARGLRERVAAVAADLRTWIATGEAADPLPVARIAAEFDALAHEVESEVASIRVHPPREAYGVSTSNVTLLR